MGMAYRYETGTINILAGKMRNWNNTQEQPRKRVEITTLKWQ